MNSPGREDLSFRFRAYGLVFAASIPIPEMVPIGVAGTNSSHPDVAIVVTDFPDELTDPAAVSSVHQVNSNALLLRVPHVARYLVRGGREILIDPDPSASDHDVRVYLLGTCLGALLHQRGFLVLHASGIATEIGCVLFTGESGSGKSTLLNEFLKRGFQMVVDDVCAIRVDQDAAPTVVPSYPRTRLWADAADRLAIDTTGLPRTKTSWDKFERQVPEQFADSEVALIQVIHLTGPDDGRECRMERLGPMEAFMTLVGNTYRGSLLDGLDKRTSHFNLASQTAQRVSMVRMSRPTGVNSVAQLADLVLEGLTLLS